MNWNWDNFRFFLALAENHTLIAAANELEVSHTTVLRRIKAFEAQLGTQLFTHSTDGYRLTTKGLELRSLAYSLKSSVDSIARTVVGSNDEIGGKITVTTPDTLGYLLMPGILTKLAAKHPTLQVQLLIQNNLTDITRLEAEVAIRASSNPPPDLIGKKLGTLNFCVCASRAYLAKTPITAFPSNLESHRFIVLTSNFNKTNFQQWLLSQISADQICIVADGVMSAFKLCCSGIGIALLPEYILNYNANLVKIDSLEVEPYSDLWVLNHKDLRNSANVKAFKDFLSDELKPVFS